VGYGADPDVVVLPLEQWQEMGSREALIRLEEPPLLLVVEVVSESSRAADYRAKRAEYCVLGIGEYWVVDPLEEKVSLLLLHEGWYDVLELKGSDPVSSKVFPSWSCRRGRSWLRIRVILVKPRGVSSVGRALRSHRRGQGFEFPTLH
jgi:Uma2 family endonuclease